MCQHREQQKSLVSIFKRTKRLLHLGHMTFIIQSFRYFDRANVKQTLLSIQIYFTNRCYLELV